MTGGKCYRVHSILPQSVIASKYIQWQWDEKTTTGRAFSSVSDPYCVACQFLLLTEKQWDRVDFLHGKRSATTGIASQEDHIKECRETLQKRNGRKVNVLTTALLNHLHMQIEEFPCFLQVQQSASLSYYFPNSSGLLSITACLQSWECD